MRGFLKKFIIFFFLSVFISISFISVSHFHKDSATGTKAVCPLCNFSHTVPVVPSTHTINLFPVVHKKTFFFEHSFSVASPSLVLPDQRGPPLIATIA
jgi:hypothetical protein